MDIHILRDGKQTGPFSEETVQMLLKQGSILISDLAWQPGMQEWLPLHAVLYPAAQPPKSSAAPRTQHPIPIPTPAPASAPEDVPASQPAAPSGAEPASQRQKAFLSYIGTPFKADLTKEQAALLVNDAMENPKNSGKLKRWDEERLRLYPDLFAEEIKSRRENRAQHFLEVCQTEGAEFFDGVSKAHTQVLVGYLDVRFPNWDKEEHSAKYDYFFPAISEKFPQLLTKAAKGRFKYSDGPRVAPELVRRPVAVRARTTGSFLGAVFRGVVFGGVVLALIIAAVKYGKGELQLPFDLPLAMQPKKPAPGSNPPGKNAASNPGESSSAAIRPAPAVASSGTTAAPNTSLPPGATRLPAPAPTPVAPATLPPVASNPSAQSGSTKNPDTGAPPESSLPPSLSLFDTPPPPAATPAPAVTTPGATPAPQVVIGRMNKPTLVNLKFGTSTIPKGQPVQVVSIDGAQLKIRFGPDVVSVPATNVDLPESASSTNSAPTPLQ
jgi:hypothetical protein